MVVGVDSFVVVVVVVDLMVDTVDMIGVGLVVVAVEEGVVDLEMWSLESL